MEPRCHCEQPRAQVQRRLDCFVARVLRNDETQALRDVRLTAHATGTAKHMNINTTAAATSMLSTGIFFSMFDGKDSSSGGFEAP
jgi:hypothetical protein